MAVRPGPVLFHDPSRQPSRGIGEPVADGLWLGPVLMPVRAFGFLPSLIIREVAQLVVTQRRRRPAEPERAEMDAGQRIGMTQPELRRDAGADVAAVRAEPSIAQPFGHE